MNNGTATVISDPKKIEFFRLLTLRTALSLELKGLKHSRVSVYAMVKREFGLKGSKQTVFTKFSKIVEESRPA
jgi:hypothetical protein